MAILQTLRRWLCPRIPQQQTVSIAEVLLKAPETVDILDRFDFVSWRGTNAWSEEYPYIEMLNTEDANIGTVAVKTRTPEGEVFQRWAALIAWEGKSFVFVFKPHPEKNGNWHGDGFLKLVVS
jgi:hypothetical protein